eukprot:1160844-Prymnesium_polylepis.1
MGLPAPAVHLPSMHSRPSVSCSISARPRPTHHLDQIFGLVWQENAVCNLAIDYLVLGVRAC